MLVLNQAQEPKTVAKKSRANRKTGVFLRWDIGIKETKWSVS